MEYDSKSYKKQPICSFLFKQHLILLFTLFLFLCYYYFRILFSVSLQYSDNLKFNSLNIKLEFFINESKSNHSPLNIFS